MFSVPNKIDSAIVVYPNTSYYEIGSDVTLTCSIRYIKPSYIDVSIKVHIKWMPEGVSTSFDLRGNTSHSLQYPVYNLKLSQAGQYKCSYFIDTAVPNPYINPSVIKCDTININAISKLATFQTFINCFCYFIVPISSTSLVLNDLQPHYEVGNNVILTCFVTELNSHHVDIDTNVNIQWSSQRNPLKQSHTHSYNKGFTHTLNNVKLSDAGEYKCSYYLTSANDNPYFKPSEAKMKATNVTIKSKLSFRVIVKHHY